MNIATILSGDPGDIALGLVMLLVILVIYFVPTAVAWNKRSFGPVAAINFFLGWTLVGWVVALAWALKDETPTKVIANQTPTDTVLCASCGKYSPTGSQFCPHCGAGFSVGRLAELDSAWADLQRRRSQ